MGKIYRTTGKVSLYKMPYFDTSSFSQAKFIQKITVQLDIDGVPLLIFFTHKGDRFKVPHSVKITPDHNNSISFIYCGTLEPNKERVEYDIEIEYSVKVILDIIEDKRGFSITENQKNILLKKL